MKRYTATNIDGTVTGRWLETEGGVDYHQPYFGIKGQYTVVTEDITTEYSAELSIKALVNKQTLSADEIKSLLKLFAKYLWG